MTIIDAKVGPVLVRVWVMKIQNMCCLEEIVGLCDKAYTPQQQTYRDMYMALSKIRTEDGLINTQSKLKFAAISYSYAIIALLLFNFLMRICYNESDYFTSDVVSIILIRYSVRCLRFFPRLLILHYWSILKATSWGYYEKTEGV